MGITPRVVAWSAGRWATPMAIAWFVLSLMQVGCSTESATAVTADQFNRQNAPEGAASRLVVPPEVFGPAAPTIDTRVMAGPDATFIERNESVTTTLPDGTRTSLPIGPELTAAVLPPGRPWPVDGLVGQINGKAIYADEFLKGMSDRLAQAGRNPDRAVGRRDIIGLVSERFEEEVNNRLIISEAESSIPPEAREGLFEWLRTLQEEEIAERGGTRSAATASMQEQFGMTVEQFLERRKNMALAGDLIRRRIAPRAIVSWRDVERAYDRASEEFAPGATIVIGRIVLRTREDAAKIEEAKAQFASGAEFQSVAAGLKIAKDGVWLERTLDAKGIDGLTDLREEMRAAMKDLPVGKPSAPIVLGPATVWLCVLSLNQPPVRSLFEPDVQLRIRAELEGARMTQEQTRYFEALRSRWISDDIDQMRVRIVDIALRRYMQ